MMTTKRNSFYVRIKNNMIRPVKNLFHRYEVGEMLKEAKLSYGQIFIIGAPRSGTTLCYQLITHCFDCAYFCNLANRHAHFPLTITRMFRPLIKRQRSTFSSRYGESAGSWAPSEGLDIWSRWFSDGYMSRDDLTSLAAREVRGVVAQISCILDAPFVNKDPHHTVRVQLLDALFPSCLFIFVDREPVETALSMLEIRQKRHLDENIDMNIWTSVKPKEYALLQGESYTKQICGQVFYLRKNAFEDLRNIARNRFIIVNYRDMCRNPRDMISQIRSFIESQKVPLRQRNDCPTAFHPAGRRYSTHERKMIEEGLRDVSAQSGFIEATRAPAAARVAGPSSL